MTSEEGNCCTDGVFVPGIPPCLDGKCDDYVCFACNKACGRSEPGNGCCVNCCNHNACCRKIGSIGLDSVEPKRGPIMITLTVLSFIQFVACIYACFGLSNSEGTIKNTYWAKAVAEAPKDMPEDQFVEKTLYMGVSSVVIEQGDDVTTIKWSDACKEEETTGGINYCTDCENAVAPIYTSAIMTTIAKLGQLLTDIQRSTADGDVSCQKTMGMLTGFFATATTLAAFQTFSDACYKTIDDISENLSASAGPGYIVMLIMVILGFVDGFAHCILKVPVEARNRSSYGFPNNLKTEDEIKELSADAKPKV